MHSLGIVWEISMFWKEFGVLIPIQAPTFTNYEMLAMCKPPFPLLWKEGDHESSLIRLSWASTTQSSSWYFLSDLTHCTGTGSSFQSWNWRMLQAPQLKCCLGFFFCFFFKLKGSRICHHDIHPFSIRIIFSWSFSRNRHRRSLENWVEVTLFWEKWAFIREVSVCKGVFFSVPGRWGWLNL